MALVSGGRSTLNPDAPLFIPAAFRQVEDFSPEWWQLVTTSTWYHDYWLSQHQDEDGFYDNSEEDIDGYNVADLLPDAFDFGAADDFSNMEAQFEEFIQSSETERGNKSPFSASNKMKGHGLEVDVNGIMNNLSLLRSFEGRGPRSPVEPAKYAVKAPKSVGMKCSPRRIQQPR